MLDELEIIGSVFEALEPLNTSEEENQTKFIKEISSSIFSRQSLGDERLVTIIHRIFS